MQFAEDAAERLIERLRYSPNVIPLGHPLHLSSDLKGSEVYFKFLTRKWKRNNQPVTLAQKLRLA